MAIFKGLKSIKKIIKVKTLYHGTSITYLKDIEDASELQCANISNNKAFTNKNPNFVYLVDDISESVVYSNAETNKNRENGILIYKFTFCFLKIFKIRYFPEHQYLDVYKTRNRLKFNSISLKRVERLLIDTHHKDFNIIRNLLSDFDRGAVDSFIKDHNDWKILKQ